MIAGTELLARYLTGQLQRGKYNNLATDGAVGSRFCHLWQLFFCFVLCSEEGDCVVHVDEIIRLAIGDPSRVCGCVDSFWKSSRDFQVVTSYSLLC